MTLPRQVGDDVRAHVRPADALPPGFVPAPRLRLERVAAGDVLPRLRVTAAAIELLLANGSTTPWPLSPADQAALRAEDAAGQVSDRFLAHAAARLDGLETVATLLGVVDPSVPFADTLPNRPSRWLYRLRAVDAAGRPSPQGQVLPLVLHVPSPARSVAPQLESVDLSGGIATVRVRARGSAGETIFVFVSADESLNSADATLAMIQNRPDLAADMQIVVRDSAGRRVSPTPVTTDATGAGEVLVPVPPDGLVLHVWALAVTQDGVPSRLVGPLHAAMIGAGA
jgi:hypothetical protein